MKLVEFQLLDLLHLAKVVLLIDFCQRRKLETQVIKLEAANTQQYSNNCACRIQNLSKSASFIHTGCGDKGIRLAIKQGQSQRAGPEYKGILLYTRKECKGVLLSFFLFNPTG